MESDAYSGRLVTDLRAWLPRFRRGSLARACEERLQLSGVEPIRPFSTLVSHRSVSRYDIEPLRPGIERPVHCIVHPIGEHRHAKFQPGRASCSDLLTLLQ